MYKDLLFISSSGQRYYGSIGPVGTKIAKKHANFGTQTIGFEITKLTIIKSTPTFGTGSNPGGPSFPNTIDEKVIFLQN